MTLVTEIRDQLTDDSIPVGQILRKCMVLARQLDFEPLSTWATHELKGYPDGSELPDYREVGGVLVGDVILGLNQYSNYPVPDALFSPEELKSYRAMRLWGPIAQIEETSKQEFVFLSTAPYLLGQLNKKMHAQSRHQSLRSISLHVSGGEYLAIVENVRTRALEFVLELAALHQQLAIEATPPTTFQPPKEELARLFQHIVINNGHTIIQQNPQGSPAIQVNRSVQEGDEESLRSWLSAAGVDNSAIALLFGLLEKNPDALHDWVTNQATAMDDRGAQFVHDVASGTSSDLLATAIIAYAPWAYKLLGHYLTK